LLYNKKAGIFDYYEELRNYQILIKKLIISIEEKIMKFLELVEQLFAQYGYVVLWLGLPLDAIALPIPPGNTTLTYTGYLCYKGVLYLLPALAAAYIGSLLGITITYWLGNTLGIALFERYGKWLRLKTEHLEQTRKAYEKYGNIMLLFSYFMPGVRQFFGYFAGIIHVPYRIFSFYAYIGSALWVLVFIGVGYVFGNQWQFAFTLVERFFKYIFIGFLCLIAFVILLKWRSKSRTSLYKNGNDSDKS
jgi:membrane protein DedA with SNARE-associated domain